HAVGVQAGDALTLLISEPPGIPVGLAAIAAQDCRDRVLAAAGLADDLGERGAGRVQVEDLRLIFGRSLLVELPTVGGNALLAKGVADRELAEAGFRGDLPPLLSGLVHGDHSAPVFWCGASHA